MELRAHPKLSMPCTKHVWLGIPPPFQISLNSNHNSSRLGADQLVIVLITVITRLEDPLTIDNEVSTRHLGSPSDLHPNFEALSFEVLLPLEDSDSEGLYISLLARIVVSTLHPG